MDIRSFFQKKGGSTSKPKAASPAKAAPKRAAKKSTEPEPTPPPRASTRRAAKKEVVVLDDSESDDAAPSSTTKRAATKKHKKLDDDSDFEMEESDANDDDEMVDAAPKAPAPRRKRLRRSVLEDEDEDEDMPEVAISKPTPVTSKSVVKKEAGVTQPVKSELPVSTSSLKKVPAPCAGCLDGKTFAFSGVLENLSHDEAVHLVKCCGGSVGSSSVTRNTSYLVVGSTLEQGGDVSQGTKYKDALAKGVRILTQNQFYNLITEAAAAQHARDFQAEKSKAKSKAALGSVNSSAKGKQKLSTVVNDELWTDKYSPKTLDHMIGNIELGRKLKQWLMDWEAVHVKGTKKVPFTTKLSENRGAKTVLLSGPPGIGKTTIANLVARECGFECTELNASDTRSKKMLQSGLKDVLGTQALQFGPPTGKSKEKMHLARRVVIMDEVDGMSGGDRGGTAELIQLVKKSKTPIICICNDRQSQKVRSLANHSFDLRMRRPTKGQIAKRLMEIGLKEGLNMEKNAIEEAADRCGNDIRQLLTQMQRWRLTTTNITYKDMVDPTAQHNKDESLRLNPFSATQQIFQRDMSFDARNEAYFVDYDLMPLMVQENYIQSIMNNRNSSDEKLEAAMHASEFISESDLLGNYVRMEQRWDLLTKQAAMNVGACTYAAGFIGHPEFSRWLGKNSSANKSKRLLSELSVRMRAHASGSREVIRMDYVPYMKEILLSKLLSGDENINEVVELLDECEITREDLTESMESFKFPGVKRYSYSQLDFKAKSSFTRLYNKASHKSQAVVESALGSTTIKKGRGKAAPVAMGDDEGGLAPPSDAESEAEEDDDDVSRFQSKKRGAVKRKAAATTAKKPARKAPAKKRRS